MVRFALGCLGFGLLMLSGAAALADANRQTKAEIEDKFRQLDVDLPTANTYRTASGAPGENYWQQQADYVINATLDEAARSITASETVSYKNNSPHPLKYLWFQLDQNHFNKNSVAQQTVTAPADDRLTIGTLRTAQSLADRPQGYVIASVTGGGRDLAYTINDTMMRVDLPTALAPGQSTNLRISWSFNIVDNKVFGGRSGFESFKDPNADIFFIAQWFPRLAAYTDYTGWQHKQFLGRGEFTLEFGNYDVSLTLPADHIVASTGVLQNAAQTLSADQRRRLDQARSATKPMYIVTPDEAKENQKEGTASTKTWRFKATNVRDFAWASSRKFIWDAMNVKQPEGGDVLAQSFFPPEADPLWSLYSTRAVAHTIDVYSRFSFPYPYPAAISVNTWERGGMEYPMISFNGYRPETDKKTGKTTYSRATKYGLIGVVIHEVGHNFFPMIVNSDERQWTWMDEGLNSFLEYMAELLWEEDFPAGQGSANQLDAITTYMASEDQVPIMTNSESIRQFGPNAYSKPTAALSVLRETVLGPDLFDFAFKEYARRWRFKRPTPADFFRTMEDASGTDLDWFWRGWFYTTDHVDLAVTDFKAYRLSTRNPEIERPLDRDANAAAHPEPLTVIQNREDGHKTYMELHPDAADFYNENDDFVVSNKERNDFATFQAEMKEEDKATFERALKENPYIYFVEFKNVGGLVSPIPLRMTYEDGSNRHLVIPAEIWRQNTQSVRKMFIETKKVTSIEVDPRHQTPDVDRANNAYPAKPVESRLDAFKASPRAATRNQMADALVELKAKEAGEGATPAAPLEPQPAPGRQ